MDWTTERKTLERMAAAPAGNSALKKKLGIINRLKNITAEAAESLIADIKSENLERFYGEIVNSILANTKIQSHEDIHKLVRIIYLYSYDPVFMGRLTGDIKRVYPCSWVHGALFAETYFLINGQVDTITKTLIKAYGEGALPLIHYLVCNFGVLRMEYINTRIQAAVDKVSEKDVEIVGAIIERLGWGVKLAVEGDYVEVVRPTPEELVFYDTAEPVPEAGSVPGSPPGVFSVHDLKKIGQEAGNTVFLDFVAEGVSENPDLVSRVLRKRRCPALIPAVARIVSRLQRGKKTIVAQLLGADYASIPQCDLLLIAELFKFDTVCSSTFTTLLSFFLKSRMLEKLCILMECSGRFLLFRRDTNKFARDLVSQLRTAAVCEVDRLRVSNCLARVHSIPRLRVDIANLLHWLFRERNFTTTGLFSSLRRSTRFLCMIFFQPSLFESDELLVRAICAAEMHTAMVKYYLSSLPALAAASRQTAFRVVEVVALLVRGASVPEQAAIIDAVLGSAVPTDMRPRMVIALLDRAAPALHVGYVEKLSCSALSADARVCLFNFCEKHGIGFPEHSDSDSFEQEIAAMR